MLLLNIGTRIGSTDMHLTLPEIVQATERAGLQIKTLAVHQSPDGTERSVVIGVRSGPVEVSGAVRGLATVLGQDCIAVWSPRGSFGKLIGPRADAWGAFDPAMFVLLDGSTLADSLPVAEAA